MASGSITDTDEIHTTLTVRHYANWNTPNPGKPYMCAYFHPNHIPDYHNYDTVEKLLNGHILIHPSNTQKLVSRNANRNVFLLKISINRKCSSNENMHVLCNLFNYLISETIIKETMFLGVVVKNEKEGINLHLMFFNLRGFSEELKQHLINEFIKVSVTFIDEQKNGHLLKFMVSEKKIADIRSYIQFLLKHVVGILRN